MNPFEWVPSQNSCAAGLSKAFYLSDKKEQRENFKLV
jgi:hypothetical protein